MLYTSLSSHYQQDSALYRTMDADNERLFKRVHTDKRQTVGTTSLVTSWDPLSEKTNAGWFVPCFVLNDTGIFVRWPFNGKELNY